MADSFLEVEVNVNLEGDAKTSLLGDVLAASSKKTTVAVTDELGLANRENCNSYANFFEALKVE